MQVILKASLCLVLGLALGADSDSVARAQSFGAVAALADSAAADTASAVAALAAPASPEARPFRVELFPPDHSPLPGGEQEEFPTDRVRGKRRELTASIGGLRYNRVEGAALEIGSSREPAETDYLPGYRASVGWAFGLKRFLYRFGIDQPVAPRAKVTLGGEAFRSVASFFYDDMIVSDGENTAGSLFLRRDSRDWFEAEGLRAWIGGRPSPFLHLSVGIVTQEERSLTTSNYWSMFRQEDRFRPNPEIPDGTYRAYEISLLYDDRTPDDRGRARPREARRGVEHRHEIRWERADPALGGDSELHRVVVDSRVYLRLSSEQSLAARLVAGAGASPDGALPPHRRFRLGGVGTLRGQALHSIVGDRMVLANLEYQVGLFERNDLLIFADGGTAWDEGTITEQRFLVDVGAGLRLGDNMVVTAARNVNRSDADVKFGLRFQETF